MACEPAVLGGLPNLLNQNRLEVVHRRVIEQSLTWNSAFLLGVGLDSDLHHRQVQTLADLHGLGKIRMALGNIGLLQKVPANDSRRVHPSADLEHSGLSLGQIIPDVEERCDEWYSIC